LLCKVELDPCCLFIEILRAQKKRETADTGENAQVSAFLSEGLQSLSRQNFLSEIDRQARLLAQVRCPG
jgi:hypothetical protein